MSSYKVMELRQILHLSKRSKHATPKLRHFQHEAPARYQHTNSSSSTTSQTSQRQVNPIGDYYASILTQPTSSQHVSNHPHITTPSTNVPPVSFTPDSEPSILFSSRLSSPLERRSEIRKKSKLVGGVWVPPRPEEPDNCCMSGCVNCVWDRYRDEIEEWATASRAADLALKKEKGLEQAKNRRRKRKEVDERFLGRETGLMLGGEEDGVYHTIASMDDDGVGSETSWGTGLDADFMSEELFKEVPVGIREFMKQEKRLKEKHAREGRAE